MRNRRLFLVVICVLLAAALRLIHLSTQSIWFDEGWSAYAAQQPTLYAASQADLTNPPLYYVLLNVAAQFFGTTEFALRVVSLLLGLLTIPLIYRLACATAGDRAGRYAALLAAISAPLWWASQEARMYTLLALLVLIAALAWQQLVAKPPCGTPSRAAWLGLWASELALLYAHNTGPVIVIWLNAVTLIYWLAQRGLRRPDWRVWIVGQVGVGLLWLPYFVDRFLLVQSANSAITTAPPISLTFAWQIWQGLWIEPWALVLRDSLIAPFPQVIDLLIMIFSQVIILLITVLLFRRRVIWLFLHVILLLAGLIGGLAVLGNDLHGRYLVMIVPLLLAAVGGEISRLPSRVFRWITLIPFVFIAAGTLVAAQNPDYQHDDVRAMVQYYADRLTAADSVIAWSYADRYDLAYYWDRLGVTAQRITLPEGADLDAVLPLLPTSGDVALNVWYTQRADYRGMMGCILGNGTVNPPDQYTVYGMSTLIYHDPVLDLPQLQPADLTFSAGSGSPVARVESIGQVRPSTADRALCLPVQIRLLQATTADLKAALIVQNDLGWTVASADAIFANASQQTSSMVAADAALTAYPLLRLPYGAPSGDYRIFLRIYDETANPSGYTPPSDGTVSGRDLLLTTWTALPGADWSQVNRPTDLPNAVNLPLSGDLTLVAHDLDSGATLVNGAEIRATLLWRGSGSLPDLELADEAGAWSVSVPPRLSDHGDVTLDWRAIRLPPDAPNGSAVLRVNGWAILARYSIESLPLITAPPTFDSAVGAAFPGVGELVGYSLSDPPFSRDDPPQLMLIWRAGESTPTVSYTVFAQLINARGQVIAQDDAIPGGRASTGWRTGEYIVDPHTLTFNDNATAGTTQLIVGLYDAATNQRIRLADGSDAVLLAQGLEVR